MLSAGFGNKERGFGTLRYGGELAEGQAHYRIYAKYFDRDTSKLLSGTDAADDWHISRTGFRVDWEQARDTLTLQGDLYSGKSGETTTVFLPNPPSLKRLEADEDISSGNLLLRWQRVFSAQSDMALQFYYDRSKRNLPLTEEKRDIFDLDFQHRFPWGSKQDIIWGLAYRFTHDDIKGSDTAFFTHPQRDDDKLSFFIQDDITLIAERLRLILGSKFEHNDYSGFEVQPNARLLWTPDERQSLWASVARAVRIPTRADHDASLVGLPEVIAPGDPRNPFPAPLVNIFSGNTRFDAEELLAYEVGYRVQATEQLDLDFTVFYNDYQKLNNVQLGAPTCSPSGIPVPLQPDCVLSASHILLPLTIDNNSTASSYGVEAILDWRMLNWWRWQGSYAYLKLDINNSGLGFSRTGQNPRHQFSLRSSLNLSDELDLNLWLRYTDELPSLNIDNYFTLDARLAWRPNENLELSLVGQNLLEQHQEFTSEVGDAPPTEVERSVYGQIKWNF